MTEWARGACLYCSWCDHGRVGLPIGTVTFVLGDVEGSSRLWEQHGERMRSALAELDGLIDECLLGLDGARPLEQGEGDSFVAAFATATEAVDFALALQLAIESRSLDGVALRVRMGVHTGEALVATGGIYRCAALNRCGRLRSLAAGGQVFVSGATADMVADHLPAHAWLDDLGVHGLRDLTRAERIHVLRHPSLKVETSQISALSKSSTNLPVQLTSFVGRAREMTEVPALLDRARLVTLTGAGGAGKTRLAIEVAAALLGHRVREAWLVDLAPITDPNLVVAAVAAAIQVSDVPYQTLDETLRAHLADREALLVLDNCEHLVAATRDLAEWLLRSCRRLSLLATSREALGAEGELIYQVSSLGLPSSAEDYECDSARLFEERARLVRPDLQLTDVRTTASVVDVCRRLDGIPLAIELAAARCRVLSPAQIAEQLNDRFALLTGGRHSALPRQRTLEASVEWSYELLSDAEQRVFRALSVFAGGWTLEAAEAVCVSSDPEAQPVFDLLAGLIDKSMVVVDELGGLSRFRMLETIRHYAQRRLVEAEEAATVRDLHLAYFVELARTAGAALRGPEMVSTLGRLESELDNLRAADDWTVESDQRAAALELLGPLEEFWYRRYAAEGYRRIRAALAEAEGEPAARARACAHAMWTAWNLGEMENWAAHIGELEELAGVLGDERLEGIAAELRGWVTMAEGDEAAVSMLEQSVIQLEGRDEPWYLVDALWGLAIAVWMDGSYSRASNVAERALALARTTRNPMLIARSAGLLGSVNLHPGHFDRAAELLDEAIEGTQSLEDDQFATHAAAYKAWLLHLRGDHAEAIQLVADALTVARRQQCIPSVANGLFVRGVIEHGTEQHAAARATFAEGERYLELVGFRWATATGRALLAEADAQHGNVEIARGQVREARTLADRPFARAARPACVLAGARVEKAAGELSRAADHANEALVLDLQGGGCLTAVSALELLATVAVDRGDFEVAARLFGTDDNQRRRIGYQPPPREVDALDAAIEVTRKRLDRQTFAAAWDDGTTMGLPEVTR